MKYPTTRFVFDRKKMATKKKDALIQVEILFGSKKKYVTTGVKVFKDQWSEKSHIINTNDMIKLNERIDAVKNVIDGFINDLIANSKPFEWEELERFLNGQNVKRMKFADYISMRIDERNDISLTTKKSHRKILGSLSEYGKIRYFDDLTKANITEYYEWMLGREITKIGKDGKPYKKKMEAPTVAHYMKILRAYIHDAIIHEIIDRDPSVGIKVKRSEYEQNRWLTEEEVKKLEKANLSTGSLVRVRDLFIFSCYSGLAYSDLMDFKPEKLEKDGKNTFLIGKRVKTGQEYIVLVLPKVKEILEKYEYELPHYSNQQYNKRLKDVAEEAGIDKPLTSHYARHTCGMLLLNNGVRIEVVAKVLGHATIRETEKVYASILKKTVVKEMNKMKN